MEEPGVTLPAIASFFTLKQRISQWLLEKVVLGSPFKGTDDNREKIKMKKYFIFYLT